MPLNPTSVTRHMLTGINMKAAIVTRNPGFLDQLTPLSAFIKKTIIKILQTYTSYLKPSVP